MYDVNVTLSHFSDRLFIIACATYAIAMALLVVELASVRAKALEVRDAQRELVGSGAPVATKSTPGIVVPAAQRPFGERAGRAGFAVLLVGFVAQVSSVVLRGIATHRAPWGNMYEFVAISTAAAVGVSLFVLRRPDRRPILAFVMVPVLILLGVAGKLLYQQAGPVIPALKSYWLAIHVSIVSIGSGIFLVSGVASVLFLLRLRFPEGAEPRGVLGNAVSHLPGARVLDRVAYVTVIVAFPLFSAGVICGAIWAEAAWGRFWGWDPKETVSFVSWVVYAAYLHARATAGWRNTRAAWINIVGFAAMLFNLFVINYVVSGLHSYAGG